MPLVMPSSSASALRVIDAAPPSVGPAAQMRSQELEPISPLTPQETGLQEDFVLPDPPPQQGSATLSSSLPSIFDAAEEPQQQDESKEEQEEEWGEEEEGHYTLPTTAMTSNELNLFDLKPPPPIRSHEDIEALAPRFFSIDHLDVILRDFALTVRFTRFLNQFQPQHVRILQEYAELRKAIAGVQYANAVASQLQTPANATPYIAATLGERFEEKLNSTVVNLVEEALPAFLTHRLVSLVTETLVREITGNNAPIMREMIPALAEVYCMTDPSLPDNPIVYASDEFFKSTQYSNNYVIGRNCRFLQGHSTSPSTVRRLVEALKQSHEVCETILNYRRDGSPFMNLLMIAPLYDNKGNVKYFLGCQIDVSPLIEGGHGMESFSQLLAQDRSISRFGSRGRHPKQILGELGQMLSEDEAAVVKESTKKISLTSQASAAGRATAASAPSRRRVVIGMEQEDLVETYLWPNHSHGPLGRLPGVYKNVRAPHLFGTRDIYQELTFTQYLLVRPYPSLRVTFTSPTLRIPGLLQSQFLDHVGGPQSVQDGLLDAFMHGTGVTARISWLTGGFNTRVKPRWIHCTPLLGSDERVGVWMVVMVENESVTGQLNRRPDNDLVGPPSVPPQAPSQTIRAGPHRHFSTKLYADNPRRGESLAAEVSQKTALGFREKGSNDNAFRDF